LLGILCSLLSSRLRFVAAVLGAGVATWTFHLPLKMNILAAIGAVVLFCWMAESSAQRWRSGREVSGVGA
jgi:hypothetical protein